MQLYKLEYIIGRLRFKMLTQNISKREFNSVFLMHISQVSKMVLSVSRDSNGKKGSGQQSYSVSDGAEPQ